MKINSNQVVFTNKARCRDCYRCIRVCPVKAIEMKDGQAFVIEDRCIDCGTCIENCPQQAKTYRRDIDEVKNLLKLNKKVAISVAPSFAGFYERWQRERLASALRKCGFSFISETSVGAWFSSIETKKIMSENSDKSLIASACPAVVNFIEKYKPECIPNLVTAASPMVIHARMLKAKLGNDYSVVFVGPCIAKKSEADRSDNRDIIDYVITFEELNELFADENINLANFEDSAFDETPPNAARFYPLTGGLLHTADLDTDMLSQDIIGVSGFEDVDMAVDFAVNSDKPVFIEPLFCLQGCLNGPASDSKKNLFERRADLIDYTNNRSYENATTKETSVSLACHFDIYRAVEQNKHSEDAILSILEKTGNADPLNQLNCQACGYASCRDKAIAVLNNMAEVDMCIPFMRRKAEMRNDKIIESSPNGIVIVDEQLKILSMNPAFRKYFMCSESIAGKPISYLMDPEPFVRIATTDEEIIELTVKHDNYGIVCHQIIYELKNENQYVGIFVNITKNISDKSELDELRENTLNQARELLKHQVSMAQNIAKLLGESTAHGEALVENILQFTEETEAKKKITGENDKKGWLWDMYTSK